jgi:GntR family transcriptional regulator|nr:GntR family transcriptional regulator [uncultured Romboutsia sp.]
MIINLNFESEVPIYLQLRNEIVIGIGKGEFIQGESIPTVRQMAEDLGINPMTVNKAYGLLKREGFITIDRRHGAKVNLLSGGKLEFKEKLEKDLNLVISEASIKGVKKEEFMDMCENIFSMMKCISLDNK